MATTATATTIYVDDDNDVFCNVPGEKRFVGVWVNITQLIEWIFTGVCAEYS